MMYQSLGIKPSEEDLKLIKSSLSHLLSPTYILEQLFNLNPHASSLSNKNFQKLLIEHFKKTYERSLDEIRTIPKPEMYHFLLELSLDYLKYIPVNEKRYEKTGLEIAKHVLTDEYDRSLAGIPDRYISEQYARQFLLILIEKIKNNDFNGVTLLASIGKNANSYQQEITKLLNSKVSEITIPNSLLAKALIHPVFDELIQSPKILDKIKIALVPLRDQDNTSNPQACTFRKKYLEVLFTKSYKDFETIEVLKDELFSLRNLSPKENLEVLTFKTFVEPQRDINIRVDSMMRLAESFLQIATLEAYLEYIEIRFNISELLLDYLKVNQIKNEDFLNLMQNSINTLQDDSKKYHTKSYVLNMKHDLRYFFQIKLLELKLSEDSSNLFQGIQEKDRLTNFKKDFNTILENDLVIFHNNLEHYFDMIKELIEFGEKYLSFNFHKEGKIILLLADFFLEELGQSHTYQTDITENSYYPHYVSAKINVKRLLAESNLAMNRLEEAEEEIRKSYEYDLRDMVLPRNLVKDLYRFREETYLHFMNMKNNENLYIVYDRVID